MHAASVAGLKKDAELLGRLICQAIEAAGPDTVVAVVQDSAAVNIAAGDFVQARYPHIGMLRCAAHFINLTLADMAARFQFMQTTFEEANEVVKCISSSERALSLYRKMAAECGDPVELLSVCTTRFCSQLLVAERLVRVREAVISTLESTRFLPFFKDKVSMGHA
jgi:microcystin degradation protein MlrC